MILTCILNSLLIILSRFEDINNLSLFSTYCDSCVKEKVENRKISFGRIKAQPKAFGTTNNFSPFKATFNMESYKTENSLDIFLSLKPRSTLQMPSFIEIVDFCHPQPTHKISGC